MILHVLKKPSSDTLARVKFHANDNAPVPPGWEAMTQAEYEAWQAAEIAAGWVAVPVGPPPVAEPTIESRLAAAEARITALENAHPGGGPNGVAANAS